MELRQLRHFVELANSLNFRIAAEACHIAQPALSISIKKLEAEIGTRLFDRRTREVTLTAAGENALSAAQAALDAANETAALARSVMKGESGFLTIGIVASAAYQLLPRVLPAFRAAYPKVKLDFVESTTEEIVEAVLERRFNLGIVRSPLAFSSSCKIRQVERDELVAILPPRHRLSKRRNIGLQELAQDEFVIYSATKAPALHAVVTLACQSAGFVPRIAQEAIQLQTIASFVRAGIGVALVPLNSIDWIGHRLKVCRLNHLSPKMIEVGLSVVTADRVQPLLVNRLLSFLTGDRISTDQRQARIARDLASTPR